MIAKDQPTIFGLGITAAVSSKSDGDMSFGREEGSVIAKNRTEFLKKLDLSPDHTTLVRISYHNPDQNPDHFVQYSILTDEHKSEGMLNIESSSMVADALVVTKPGHALFLPIADCVGLILYDPKIRVLMVSHVGRHSAEIEGAKKSVNYLIDNLSSDPKDLKVWLSPAVGKATYPLHAMDGKSLHEVILEQLTDVGVVQENIQVSDIDTADNEEYFSHSKFLEGERVSDGRFAIVASMTEQGEPAL